MTKIFTYLFPVLALLIVSCNGDVNERLDRLENDRIITIEQQLAAMNSSADELESAIVLLQGYSASLSASAAELQRAINTTNAKIKVLEESADRNSKDVVNLINELNSLKSTTGERLSQLYAMITQIEQTVSSLDAQLVEVKNHIEKSQTEMRYWAEVTFATLEQYNTLLSEVVLVQTLANTTSKSFKEFETSTSERLTAIEAQLVEMNEAMYYAYMMIVRDVTEAYSQAITEAEAKITAAYTQAIADAVKSSEEGLKAWVGEQFDQYYDIAQVEARLAELRLSISDDDAQLQREVDAIAASLATAKEELTAAYKRAIEEAITTNDGKINTRIAEAISAAEAVSDARIDRLESRLDSLAERIAELEATITKLLARIQSLTYIPTDSDARATVDATTRLATFDFHVSPASCVTTLAEMWESAVAFNAVKTISRAVTLIPLTITRFEADTVQGIVSVTVSCDALGETYFEGATTASAAMFISDGNNSIISDYIELVVR